MLELALRYSSLFAACFAVVLGSGVARAEETADQMDSTALGEAEPTVAKSEADGGAEGGTSHDDAEPEADDGVSEGGNSTADDTALEDQTVKTDGESGDPLENETVEPAHEATDHEPFDYGTQYPAPVEGDDAPLTKRRLLEAGALVGPVIRPGDSSGIGYGTGVGFGGYLRPEITPWLSVRAYYRQEYIPVDVQAGGFDYQGDTYEFEFSQPDLDVVSIGLLVEPVWVVHPRVRLFGQAGLAWVQLIAPAPEADGFELDGTRTGIEVNIPLGVGATFDIIQDWFAASLSVSHGFSIEQRGTAYEPLQAVVDGSITYLAPLPKPDGVTEVLFTLGIVL